MILENFLTTSFQNVRSSKRTDELHKVLLDEVLNANPLWADYDWKFEYQLPVDGFGGTFDIDIAAFDSEGHLTVAILAKAINSNVNKNIKNYANTSIGEQHDCGLLLTLLMVILFWVIVALSKRFSSLVYSHELHHVSTVLAMLLVSMML